MYGVLLVLASGVKFRQSGFSISTYMYITWKTIKSLGYFILYSFTQYAKCVFIAWLNVVLTSQT